MKLLYIDATGNYVNISHLTYSSDVAARINFQSNCVNNRVGIFAQLGPLSFDVTIIIC
jgi:hypothetical protein